MKVISPTRTSSVNMRDYISPTYILNNMNSKQYGYGSAPVIKFDGTKIATEAAQGAIAGAASGASVGTVFPGIGTAIGAGVGAAIGAIGGAISGFFNAKADQKKAQHESDERFADNIAADTKRAESIVDQNKYDGNTTEGGRTYYRAALGGEMNINYDQSAGSTQPIVPNYDALANPTPLSYEDTYYSAPRVNPFKRDIETSQLYGIAGGRDKFRNDFGINEAVDFISNNVDVPSNMVNDMLNGEGYIDQLIRAHDKSYRTAKANKSTHQNSIDSLMKDLNSFESLGLHTYMEHVQRGNVPELNGVEVSDTVNNYGSKRSSIKFNNHTQAIEAGANMVKYFYSKARERYPNATPEELRKATRQLYVYGENTKIAPSVIELDKKYNTNKPKMAMGGEVTTYNITSGDSLSKIASANNLTLQDIIKSNPQIQNPDNILVGESINIPKGIGRASNPTSTSSNISPSQSSPIGTNYTVKKGDSLTTISRNLNIPIDDIMKANSITDPNRIEIGQSLQYSNNDGATKFNDQLKAKHFNPLNAENTTHNGNSKGAFNIPLPRPSVKVEMPRNKMHANDENLILSDTEIKKYEAEINAKPNLAIITEYHISHKSDMPYVVTDKARKMIGVYRDGELIKEWPTIIGFTEGDDLTVTVTDDDGKIINKAGNGTTTAGISYLDSSGTYGGAPSYYRRTQDQLDAGMLDGIPNAIHSRNVYAGANTNGCTGMNPDDLRELDALIKNYKQIPSYILPIEEGNKFHIRNGKLQFKSKDTSKLAAHNTIVSRPIERIDYNMNELITGDPSHNMRSKNYTVSKQSTFVKQYTRTAIDMKDTLAKELGLNSDTYNELSKVAFGVLGVESSYAEENNAVVNLAKATRKYFSPQTSSSPDYKSKYKTYNADEIDNSVGATQLRFKYFNIDQRRFLLKYGITKGTMIESPEKTYIATMVRLAHDYKNTGHDIDKVIKGMNPGRTGYSERVRNEMDKFTIYENYN